MGKFPQRGSSGEHVLGEMAALFADPALQVPAAKQLISPMLLPRAPARALLLHIRQAGRYMRPMAPISIESHPSEIARIAVSGMIFAPPLNYRRERSPSIMVVDLLFTEGQRPCRTADDRHQRH